MDFNYLFSTSHIIKCAPLILILFSFSISLLEWEIITVTGCSFDYDVTTYHRLTITCDDGDDTTSGQFVLNLTPNAVSRLFVTIHIENVVEL